MARSTHDPHPLYAELGRHPRISDDELHALARRVQAGTLPGGRLDPDATEARNAIVCGNLRLALQFAAKYRPEWLDFDEALSAALMGLMDAARKYDPDRPNRKGRPSKFAPTAFNWMRQRASRVPASRAIGQAGDDDGGGEPCCPEPIDHRAIDPAERIDRDAAMVRVMGVLVNLSVKERDALDGRFGLDGRGALSYDELGTRMGLTNNGAKYVCQRAERKVRQLLGGLEPAGGRRESA